MKFKKKKQKELPIDICKRIFKTGVIFNNGRIIEEEMDDVPIKDGFEFIQEGYNEILIRPDGFGWYTIWNENGFADIIT